MPVTALNGCNKGKRQLGLIHSSLQYWGEKKLYASASTIRYRAEGRVSLLPYGGDLGLGTMTF